MPVSISPTEVDFLQATEIPSKVASLVEQYPTINIAVAYFKETGFESLKKALRLTSARQFSKSGLTINLLVGLAESNFFLTDVEPLRKILNIRSKLKKSQRKRLRVRYYARPQFHPKMFLFEGNGTIAAIIGSSNVTGGGLKTNLEANTFYEAALKSPLGNKSHAFFKRIWTRKNGRGPMELTKDRLGTYEMDKNAWGRSESNGSPSNNNLPSGQLPKNSDAGKDDLPEPYLIINRLQYPISSLKANCVECGKYTPISEKWYRWWGCDKHGTSNFILRADNKKQPKFSVVNGRVTKGNDITGICTELVRGRYCGVKINFKTDFTHIVCKDCYEKRKRQGEPAGRIPRTRISNIRDSMFYNKNYNDIVKG